MDTEEEGSPQLKRYAGFVFLALSSIILLYYIYKYLRKGKSSNEGLNFTKRGSKKLRKQKMTINLTSLYNKEKNSPENLYQLLDGLSERFDLFLIIIIKEKEEEDSIIDSLKMEIEDNIVYKHRILFCSSIDGLCSIVRSLDPFVHIEYENYVVVNLIRYINEFWFIKENFEKEKGEIENKIKNDSNNKNLSLIELSSKIKYFKDYNSTLS